MQSYQAMTWREKSSSTLALSRIYAAPISRLGCLDRLFFHLLEDVFAQKR